MERNKHERNKKYGWLVFFALLNWVLIVVVVNKVDPENMANIIFPRSYLPMGVLLGGGIFWLLSILTLSSMRALRWTAGIMIYVYLRLWGLGSIINGVLLLALLGVWEAYLWRGREKA